jgi:DNA-binding transcriptional LysR family regulator
MQSKLKDHLNKLHAFSVVASSKSIREASLILRISQPALSRQIKTLEDIVGTHLMVRTRNGIRLSEAGRILTTFAHKVNKLSEDVETKIKNPSDGMAANIHVVTFESFSIKVWPELIGALSKKFPQTKIKVTSGEKPEIYRDMIDQKYDLAMTILHAEHSDLLTFEMMKDSFGFYCSPKFYKKSLQSKKPVPNSLLTSVPIAMVPGANCVDNQTLGQFLMTNGLMFQSIFELNSFDAALEYTLAGASLAILPHFLAKKALDEKKIVKLTVQQFPKNEIGHHRIGLIANKHNELLPTIIPLVKFICSDFKSKFEIR